MTVKTNLKLSAISLLVLFLLQASNLFPATLKMSRAVLEDKIKGGWLGKTMGVCIGGPTEWGATNAMYTDSINFAPSMAGGYSQDDLYVQIPFIQAMDSKLNQPNGIFAATMQDYGDAFRITGFAIWAANEQSRGLLQSGYLPPFTGMWAGSGHRNNSEGDAIDFQIESDWVGLMCPAMPQTAIALLDRAGHVIGYGDGLYGGYYLGACDALAFQYSDIHTIVKEAVKVLPVQSLYYRCIADIIRFHDANPDSNYAACWRHTNATWRPQIRSDMRKDRGLAAMINGAWVTIGLLYGNGDILKSIEYACRCGDDSDCNPSNAGAIVGALIGYNAQPVAWKNSLAYWGDHYPPRYYEGSQFTWTNLLTSSYNRAYKAIAAGGGAVGTDSLSIEVQSPPAPQYLEVYGSEPVLLDSACVEARLGARPYFCNPAASISFNATASIGLGLSYSWDFGDGNTSTLAKPTHAYASPDTYTVTLRVQGARGADTTQANMYIQAPTGTRDAASPSKVMPSDRATVSPLPVIGSACISLPTQAQGPVKIYSQDNGLVAVLNGVPGSRLFTWDGLDHAGRNAEPGLYVYLYEFQGAAYSGKFIKAR
jgi:hypothetical protein